MLALERQKKILEQLSSDGAVWVSKLAAEFEVTEETIRRDLEKLEKQEALIRTHGGALSVDSSMHDLSIEKRKKTNTSIKEKLAAEAVKYIIPGDTIFLDASTTTFFMARHLKKMKEITIITNSIAIINELLGAENIRVISIGGQINVNQSLVGDVAERTISESYFATKVFFSSKGLTENAGLLESNDQECAIKRKMIENSKTRYYLCDKSKLGRVGFAKLVSPDAIDYFITDCDFESDYLKKLEEYKVEVIKVD